MRQHGFFKVVRCQHIVALVNVLSHVSLDGSGFPAAHFRNIVTVMISWLSCEGLVRDLKDHMECKITAIKLLRLKLTDVYFLVLITGTKDLDRVYKAIISPSSIPYNRL